MSDRIRRALLHLLGFRVCATCPDACTHGIAR